LPPLKEGYHLAFSTAIWAICLYEAATLQPRLWLGPMLKFLRAHGSAAHQMKTEAQAYLEGPAGSPRWSIRILVLALAGIFFLTLYPFRFAQPVGVQDPLLLGHSDKHYGSLAGLLNILLFIPFGFGFSTQIKQRRPFLTRVLITFCAGALLSYLIELLQLYIPERDSGWDDIFTNSIGAIVGAVLFELCGLTVLRCLRNFEKGVEAFASKRNAAMLILFYFGVWFAVSAHLQRESRLSDWSPGAYLSVGNSARGHFDTAWKGEVYDLQLWDRALPKRASQQLTAGRSGASSESAMLADYQFSGARPAPDREHFLPDLEWVSPATSAIDPPAAGSGGAAWAITRAPVSALIAKIRKTSQFSVRVRCKPSRTAGVSAVIVSVSQPNGAADMEIHQEDDSLGFWLRTPLTATRTRPVWQAPLVWKAPKMFAAGQTRDLLFSYDGATLSAAIDGHSVNVAYHLGPGLALARFMRSVNARELHGYRYIFYSIVFFPAGSFIALGWSEHPERIPAHLSSAIAVLILAPLFLEILLVRVSGQSFSLENIGLAFATICLGAAWINLGTAHQVSPQVSLPGRLSQ